MTTKIPKPKGPNEIIIEPLLQQQTLGNLGNQNKLKTSQPKRTTKTAQKLKLFPEGVAENLVDVELEQEPSPILPHVNAETKKEEWISKFERKWLPRVTAYCTANAYKLVALFEDLKKRSKSNSTNPKRFDEAIYTPFAFSPSSSSYTKGPFEIHMNNHLNTHLSSHPQAFTSHMNGVEGELQDLNSNGDVFTQNIDFFGQEIPSNLPLGSLAKRIAPVGECLFFDYGVVVMWGLSQEEESRVLDYLVPFQEETLHPDNVEVEECHFHYNAHCNQRIYNDVITLKNPSNYMIKLTISHAIAQSVKLALFEGLIEETIESTRQVPEIMAEEGKIKMSRHAINKKIGQLFIMRINVNLVSNVLDTPVFPCFCYFFNSNLEILKEIFWSEPTLEPLYVAIRGYLEISQRVDLLNQRVGVISDLLDMLKDHLNSSHGEQLEWIVIILIAFEIVIGIITISFDLTTYLQHD